MLSKVRQLLHTTLTIPVTSATAELAFSAIRRYNDKPSAGRYFLLKYLFGTCLNIFLINHSHTVLLLHLCQCKAERWGDLKKYIFGDVVLSVIGLGGAKNGSKQGGVASRLGVFIEKQGKKRAIFSLHFGTSQALYIAGISFKNIFPRVFYPSTTGCPCMELTGCSPN